MSQPPDWPDILQHFRLPGRFRTAAPQGRGHINDTFRIVMEEGRTDRAYILQHVNPRVFPDVPGLMDNIARDRGGQQAG